MMIAGMTSGISVMNSTTGRSRGSRTRIVVGGRHDEEHADQDGGDRGQRRIAEALEEALVGEHPGIGVEGVFAAALAERELEGRDQRHDEVDRAEGDREPRPEPRRLHLIHRSLRWRSQM